MHPRTVATLDELDKADWFSRVGIQDAEGYAIVLSSWKEAMQFCASAETRNLWQEAANQYHMRVLEGPKEGDRSWNGTANDLRPIVSAFVAKKIEAVMRDNLLPKAFESHVRWDIMFLCLESEFADVYPPGFFASHAYWYTVGHFPCGWEGKFPDDGKLVVY